MAIAIPNWLSSHQVNQSVLGLQTSREHRKYSLKVCRVRKLPQFKNTFTLRIQGFQAPPPCRPKTVPLVYSEGDLCAIRPVTEVKVPEKVIEDAEVLPSSALAVADAIGTGFKVVRKSEDSKHLLSAASAEFLALCAEQLGLCEEIVGPNARFTVYIRPAESYRTGQLEFHCMAVYPSQEDELLVLQQSDALASITLAEEIIKQEAVEVASGRGAIILPMVKDTFLIGLLVVEGAARAVKSEKLRPTKPIWPPRKTTAGATAALSRQQLTELAKVARSLALACVMDQRALLLQESTLQKGDQIDSLLEEAHGPLQAMRTLGQLLLPQLKRGEISRDLVEDILVQGARMKDVLQQLHNVAQSGPNIMQSHDDQEGGVAQGSLETEFMSPELPRHSYVDNNGSTQRQGLLPAAYMEGLDLEAPMPPLSLAPVPHFDMSSPCNVAEVLRHLGQAANGLANQRGQTLQITSSSSLWAAVDAVGLRRACSHILETALQHTPKGGYVRTDAMPAPGGGVLIIIEDNGPDIVTRGSWVVPGWRGTDLENALVGEDIAFVREIVELQLGGVLRIQSPHLLDASPGAGGTHVQIWLPAVSNADKVHT